MPMRPASSTCIAFTNPSPALPTIASAGTRQSLKITSLVSLARMPSLFSFLPAASPARPALDHERRDAPGALRRDPSRPSPRACRRCVPCVMNCLLPLKDPVRRRRGRAVVRMARGVDCRRWLRSAPRRRSPRPWRAARDTSRFWASDPEHVQVRRAQAVVRGDRQRDRRIDARQLLDADAVVDRRHARRRRTPPGIWMPISPSARQPRQQLRAENTAPRPTP